MANVKVPIVCEDLSHRTLSPYCVVQSPWRALSTRVTGHFAVLGGRDMVRRLLKGQSPEERKMTLMQSLLF